MEPPRALSDNEAINLVKLLFVGDLRAGMSSYSELDIELADGTPGTVHILTQINETSALPERKH